TPFALALPLLFVTLPAILFYSLLFRDAVNIPFWDDYDALLEFLNHMTLLDGLSAKISYFLAAQHNEYKLFLLHGVAWLQYVFFGHIDFRVLSILGDTFVLLLAILLWTMFLPNRKDLAGRLVLFIPVSWLLFQFQYWETLNWSMAGLQNLPILVFSLAAINLLVKGTRAAFWGAVVLFILSVAASGNGFVLIPVGLLILVLSRSYLRVAIWILAAAVCIAAYAYHYNIWSAQTGPHRSVIANFHPFAPAYVLAFIGSAGCVPIRAGSFVVGTILCLFFIFMICRGYIRRNPLVSYCVLFLLLTAIGVAGIRSEFGVSQAVSSRYTIYSALFLIFSWFAIVEEFLQNKPASLLKNDALLIAVGISVLFSLGIDGLGMIQLKSHARGLAEGMSAYLHPSSSGTEAGPSPRILILNPDPLTAPFNRHARPILAESIRLGVYRPPQ
ncbi:MAG: hypothetical protein WBQ94_14540, partial [Terracidiphilus sp.]